MRLGISSMQRVPNYGSFLQALGLKRTLESLGHSIDFVDFEPGQVVASRVDLLKLQAKDLIRHFIDNYLIGSPLGNRLAGPERVAKVEFAEKFNSLYLPSIGVDTNFRTTAPIDWLVVGSDEVFNCMQRSKNTGFAEGLLGGAPYPQISYAASFGNIALQDLVDHGLDARVRELLSNFKMISVRDKNSANIVENLLGSKPQIHIDPVLLHGFNHEIFPDTPLLEPGYAIVYAYPKRLNADEISAIKSYATEKNIRLVAVGGFYDFCDEYLACSPYEIPALFRNADFVVTDTFHGTIFSMLTHRPFATFVREGRGKLYGNSEKLGYLLRMFNMNDRIVNSSTELESVLIKNIDFLSFEKILQNHRTEALDYLRAAFSVISPKD